MKTKLLTLFLVLVASVGTLRAYDVQIGDLYYDLNANYLTAVVTYKSRDSYWNGVNGTNYIYNGWDISNANIPSSVIYNGQTYVVKSIGDYAFCNCSDLTSVEIPNSVTSIGRYAFYGCSGLTSVTIGESVTSITSMAFSGCTSLTSVVWNAKNYQDFTNTSTPFYFYSSRWTEDNFDIRSTITSFTFGNEVERIPAYLCYGMSNLTSVTIPSSVDSIGYDAFYHCYIRKIDYNGTIEEWCQKPWSPSSISYNYSLYIEEVKVESCTIPNSVTSIGSDAFYNCADLTSVTIPNSVTSIGERAFRNCNSLTSIEIPNSVTSIGDGMFYDCRGLSSVTIPNSVTSIGDYTFYNCSGLTSMTIPNSVTSIGSSAFSGCSGLTSVEIPNSVTSIGSTAFYECRGLTSVTIPNSVTSIGSGAFYGCTGLSSVIWNVKRCRALDDSPFPSAVTSFTFGDNVEYIPAYLCYGLSNLNSISIPNSVTSIGNYAFQNCTSLTLVTLNSNAIVSKEYTSSSIKDIFGSQVNEYVIGEAVTRIGNYAFYNCTDLASLTISNSVTSIGNGAFYNCTGLPSIEIPNSVTSIGDGTFYDCSGLTSATIGNSVTIIGNYAFYNCRGLASLTIPNSVTSIGDGMFYDCRGLSSVTIPNSVTSIGDYTFYNCSGLTSMTIPNSVTSIGSSAFSGCSGLTSVEIPNSVTSIGSNAFYGCRGLTSVEIPNSVTSIGDYTFYNCSGLTSMTIGNSVTSIGNNAFYNCKGLTSVTIPNSVTSIGDYTFYNCSGLTSVTIGNSVTSIGGNAFYQCSKLDTIIIENLQPASLGSNVFGIPSSSKIIVPCSTLETYRSADGWRNYASKIQYAQASVEAVSSDDNRGEVSFPQTICEDALIATPKYGYHFVQWTDENTDNPRVVDPTESKIYTAIFDPNQYTITVQCDSTLGFSKGGGRYDYLTTIAIEAVTTKFGYHFSQWNDGSTENPRTILITKDETYQAIIAKNIYSITKITQSEQGYISGYSQAEYLDTVTLTANPRYGYHFTQWSDGNTDNPRTIVLTQDTTFTAEFAVDKSGTCGDDNLLRWKYDDNSNTLVISGNGSLNSTYTFGVEAPKQAERLIIEEGVTSIGRYAFSNMTSSITSLALPSTVNLIGDYAFFGLDSRKFNTLVLPNNIISIGAHAFDGASYLQTIHFGSALEEIGDYAFKGCTRVKQMTCLAEITPNVGTDALTSISNLAKLYIPVDYLFDYQIDNNWNRFDIHPLGAAETTVTDNNVKVEPDDNSVIITWPTNANATTYTIVITKDNEAVCTLIFNADGQLTGIAFAPSRNGTHRHAPMAKKVENGGMQFTVTGLNSSTKYGYSVVAKDAQEEVVASYDGNFSTTGDTPTNIGDISSESMQCTKIIRDGQIYILRGEKVYSITGQKVK